MYIITLNRYIVRCSILRENTAAASACPADEELIGRFRLGDEKAFEEIASRYLGLIASGASRFRDMSPDIDSADLTQEGLMALLSACASFDPGSGMSFKNYLMLCVDNRLRSIQRHIAKKGNIPAQNIVSIEDDENPAVDPTLCTPCELVETKEHIDHLHQILKDRLSDLEYKVAILHLSGYSYKEIADKLNKSLKTIDNAHTRIRQKLSR